MGRPQQGVEVLRRHGVALGRTRQRVRLQKAAPRLQRPQRALLQERMTVLALQVDAVQPLADLRLIGAKGFQCVA